MIKILYELLQEFRTVISGRTNTVDTIIPPLLYALVNMLFGLVPPTLSALVLAAILKVLRLIQKQPLYYGLSSFVFTLLAAGLAWYTQKGSRETPSQNCLHHTGIPPINRPGLVIIFPCARIRIHPRGALVDYKFSINESTAKRSI